MKRLLLLAISILIVISLSACSQNNPKTNEADDSTTSGASDLTTPAAESTDPVETAPSLPDDDSSDSAALAELLRNHLPLMDGSTSAIPLEAAIRSGIFGISREEAEKDVLHSTSHDSFYNLLSGRCSLAFSHLLSPEQYEEAENRGIAVEMTPIAREGFVFLVSAENPVESLTSDEVKRIYTGEITNWSEVGGADMPITAYQRNIDSGSQNYMRAFMGDLPLTDAPTKLRPASMDSLVDVVAAFNGEKNGIGYSVFSYVGGMYDAAGGVKLLKIDGVEPTYETICDGSYPCTGFNYIVIRAEEPEGSPARNLIEWTLSSAGQRSIAETGYFAPLLPTSGIHITIPDLHLLTAVGTGKAECVPADWCYSIAFPNRLYESGYPDGILRIPAEGEEYTYVFDYSQIIKLPETGNAALDAEITAFAAESYAALEEVCLRVEPRADYFTQYGRSKELLFISYSEFACINGYLSVRVGIHSQGISNNGASPEVSAMWDLESGKRIVLSDLFRKDAAFVPMLNNAVRHFAEEDDPNSLLSGFTKPCTISPFAGLTADFDNFGIMYGEDCENPDNMYGFFFILGLHPDNNPYFSNDVIVPIRIEGSDLCLLAEPRSLGGAYGEENVVLWDFPLGTQQSTSIPMTGGNYGDPYTYFGEFRWTKFEGFPGAEKINEAQHAYREKHSDLGAEIWTDEFVSTVVANDADYLKYMYGLENPTADQLGTARVVIETFACPLGSRYAAISYQVRVQHLMNIGYGGGTCYDCMCAVYDLETGDPVPFSEVFPQPYDGYWFWITPPEELLDGGLLGDPVRIIDSRSPGRLDLLFEPVPGEKYRLTVRHDALRIIDFSPNRE